MQSHVLDSLKTGKSAGLQVFVPQIAIFSPSERHGVGFGEAIDDYYSGSWVAISTITLNGDLARAAQGAAAGGSGALGGEVLPAAPVPLLCWFICLCGGFLDMLVYNG